MNTSIIDTNVVLVANGQHGNVSQECIAHCALVLQSIMSTGKLAIDDGFLILLEYQNKIHLRKGKRPGDAFVKWVLNHKSNKLRIEQVTLVAHKTRGFESFPDDQDLVKFDASDRKFVAVSGAHPDKPAISQATDSKWLDWYPALQRHGITVDFLCKTDIQRFHHKKFGA